VTAQSPLRVMTVVGTRPEIIRLSCTLNRLDAAFDHTLVHTGQNYDHQLNQVFFDELSLRAPDLYLGVDTSSLGQILAGTLLGTEEAIRSIQPDAMIVLGDTNSSIAAFMARRMQVPVYHLEAGNRSFDANVPEEINRHLVDHIADFNMVYTEHARRNLIAEGLPGSRITLTGSPMAEVLARYAINIERSGILEELRLTRSGYILVSAHRQENVDHPERLSTLLRTLVQVGLEFNRPVLVSTHPRTEARLKDLHTRNLEGIRFHPPFGFFDYICLQQNAYCVLSDSGTISEEAAILGFPAVTPRDAIERPEALETGAIVTTGLESTAVIDGMRLILAEHAQGAILPVPADYQVTNFAQRVVSFVRSTAHSHNARAGVRPLLNAPTPQAFIR
jgi:UDP-N-acetylglucosamine 2-epimerase